MSNTIIFYCPDKALSDLRPAECAKFRHYATSELNKKFPEHNIFIDKSSLYDELYVYTNDNDSRQFIENMCFDLFDEFYTKFNRG